MSGLAPLTSDESRQVVNHLWKAIQVMPNHRHNKNTSVEDCGTCVAKEHLIKAFRTFKRLGE